MTEKNAKELHPDDEVMTLSDDGLSAEVKKVTTEEDARQGGHEDDDEDHQEDERHAVDSGDDEERRKNRADSRRRRKDARRAREEAVTAENAALRERLASLEGRVDSVDRTSAATVIATVDGRINEANQAREAADAALEAAISGNDGKAAREAIKARDIATEALRQLNGYKANYEAHTARATEGARANQPPNPVLVNFAKRFKADNPWVEFDPATAVGKNDEDSVKVHRLDASVRAAGYDPTTPEYWEELQDRVDRNFPNHLAEMADEGDDDKSSTTRRAETQARAPQRRGPSMSGGRSAGSLGKNDIVIPKAVREAAEAAGYWKDPKDRADFIKRWKAADEKYSAKR